jgi:hypothetical protein
MWSILSFGNSEKESKRERESKEFQKVKDLVTLWKIMVVK